MIKPTLGILLLLCAPLSAEIADSGPGGFTVKQSYTILKSPQEVYRQVIRVGDWWNPAHTYSGDAHNLSIEEKAGGCFCEMLPNGGGVKHLEVVYLAPGKSILLHGALGPLSSLAATGSMQIQLTAVEGGTKLDMAYTVAGYLPAGMNTWAAPVDAMLKEQFTRLKTLLDPPK